MVFIVCGSYLNVVDTMTAIERENDSFLVLSCEPSIVRLFSEIYSPKIAFLLPKPRIVFSKPLSIFRTLMSIQRKKKEILPTLRKYRSDKLIFFFTGFEGFTLWLIKELSRDMHIYFRPEINLQCARKSWNIQLGIRVFFYSILYRISFSRKRIGGYCFGSVSKKFLKAVKVKKYQISSNFGYAKDLLESKYPDLPKIKVLVLVGGEPNIDRAYCYNEINKSLRRLMCFMRPEEIAIKVHPRISMPNLDVPSGCVILPQYLPASLILLRCQIVIAYMSGALFEAANQGKKAIALLEMLSPISQKQTLEHKDYMLSNISNSGKICFPLTVDELLSEVQKELSFGVLKNT